MCAKKCVCVCVCEFVFLSSKMDRHLLVNQINQLFELAWLQKIKMLINMPRTVFIKETKLESFKEFFCIHDTVLYMLDCVVISPKAMYYVSGISVGEKATNLPNVVHYPIKNIQQNRIDFFGYLTYCMQTMNIQCEKRMAVVWDQYSSTSNWKTLLIQEALGPKNIVRQHLRPEYSTCSNDCFSYVIQSYLPLCQNVSITFDNKISAKLINVHNDITVLQCLLLLKNRIRLHRLDQEDCVDQITEQVNAMLSARLRFITSCVFQNDINILENQKIQSMRNRQCEMSFGQLISLTNDAKWQDPDREMMRYISVDCIRQIVWAYVINISEHLKLLDSKLAFQDNLATIEIIPSVSLQNYDERFMLSESAFTICSQCDSLACIKYGSFLKSCTRMQSSCEIAVFSPNHQILDFPIPWISLPRQVVLKNLYPLKKLEYSSSNLGLSDILLFNAFAELVSNFILTGDKRNHDFEVWFGNHTMWVGRHKFAMIQEHSDIMMRELDCSVETTLFFLKSKCKFISRYHFDCIRNIRYLSHDKLGCLICPWTKVIEAYQHGDTSLINMYYYNL